MQLNPAEPVSVVCFDLILVSVVSAIVAGVYFAHRKTVGLARRRAFQVGAGAAFWLLTVSMIVENGFLSRFPMPWLMIFFGAINLFSICLAISPIGYWLAKEIPLGCLVGFQCFRFPLELVLHAWAEQRVIPITMTWNGYNFDIITGLLAIVLAPLANRHRIMVWVFNGIGFFLLLNVMRIAIFSSPLPFAWKVDPPLLLAFNLPYAFIIPVCVGGALFGHIVLTRALISYKKLGVSL